MDSTRAGWSISLPRASQAKINDFIKGIEVAVGEPAIPHELPYIFDRIELWTFAQQRFVCKP
jgi:hypothetical protein